MNNSSGHSGDKRGVALVLILTALIAVFLISSLRHSSAPVKLVDFSAKPTATSAAKAQLTSITTIASLPDIAIEWFITRINIIEPEFYKELEEMKNDLNNQLGLNLLTAVLEKVKGLYSQISKLLLDIWNWARTLFSRF